MDLSWIAEMAVKGLLYEVSATPKPGLVDRFNNGAHNDMDFYSFMASSSVLYKIFEEIAYLGYSFEGEKLKDLLKNLRSVGIKGEKKMFESTGSVNTHKGAIFSLGIACGAIGNLLKTENIEMITASLIQERIKAMTEGLCEQDLSKINKDTPTHGEILYLKQGTLGIRGEAEAGFPVVFSHALPYLLEHKTLPYDQLFVNTLFVIISKLEDSTILWRHCPKVLARVKSDAIHALELGGMTTKEGRNHISLLDKNYNDLGISPGGAADMLALSILIWQVLENLGVQND